MQLQQGARRLSHTGSDRSRSAVDAGMRRLYRSVRLAPRPVRPLLRPLWNAIDRRADPHAERPAGSFPATGMDRPIRPMTRKEFDELAARSPYYRGRQGYLGAAAWIASDLIERFGVSTALELGPNVRPLMSGADVMDRVTRPGLEASGQLMRRPRHGPSRAGDTTCSWHSRSSSTSALRNGPPLRRSAASPATR